MDDTSLTVRDQRTPLDVFKKITEVCSAFLWPNHKMSDFYKVPDSQRLGALPVNEC